MKLALVAVLVISGCSATTSAIGNLLGSKPNQVTVVTNVQTPTPVEAPKPAATSPAKAMIGGGLAGALAGGVTGVAMHGGATALLEGAAIGAGVGSLVGYAVHEAAD